MGIGAWLTAASPRGARRRRTRSRSPAPRSSLVGRARCGSSARTSRRSTSRSPRRPRSINLIELVRAANDLDRDGFGSLLGENDCSPLDATIHPGARDMPDDGIDQNCDGHDFSLRATAAPTRPARCRCRRSSRSTGTSCSSRSTRVRYDHTTFGGYDDSAEAPRHHAAPRRARRSDRRQFTFCNAPSAGTMASIPAIITSKFFHSGIALDENVPPGTPPRLKPENTTLPEIMKRGGYHTGVIASHEYWNDWGMDQGVDDYDNSIGKNARSVPRRGRQGHRPRARVDLAPAGQEVVPVGALHRSARPLRRAPRRRRLRLERARPLRRRDPVDRSADRPPVRRARAPAEQRQHDHHPHERSRRLDGRAHRAGRHARHRALPRAPARADDLLHPEQPAAEDRRRGHEPRHRADDRRARRHRRP